MIPQDALDAASAVCWNRGLRVLQGVRFGPTDAAHISALLRYMAPRPKTAWLDIGCGFGEVARLMHDERPDLSFVLLNNNAEQLGWVPPAFRTINADMHALPLDDGCMDGCMFLYSLCHADAFDAALAEAARVTRPGGGLFVFDYERLRGSNELMQDRLFSRAISFDALASLAELCGWEITWHVNPPGDDTLFRELYGNDSEYGLIFRDLAPVIWKARRA